MEKLNELVQQAKEMSQLHGAEWSSALCESGVDDNGKKHHAIISDSKNDFVIDTGSDSNEASWLCDYLELCSPANILAIAEAFRALEQRVLVAEQGEKTFEDGFCSVRQDRDEWQQRAEAAEAKLAEREQRESVAWIKISKQGFESGEKIIDYFSEKIQHLPEGTNLFTRPAPAADLAELVPDEMPTSHIYHGGNGAFNAGKESGWNACRAAILRKIEGG